MTPLVEPNLPLHNLEPLLALENLLGANRTVGVSSKGFARLAPEKFIFQLASSRFITATRRPLLQLEQA